MGVAVMLGADEEQRAAIAQCDSLTAADCAVGARIVASQFVKRHGRAYRHTLRRVDRAGTELPPVLVAVERRRLTSARNGVSSAAA
jgi:uncharacterized lipoprotein NlpE involved in copper resistance